ncbi:hypothetical protein D1007_00643 [Hordeum vulgare]|nr:hypothetical protein D1007_00643 [Hordeum vulgare]
MWAPHMKHARTLGAPDQRTGMADDDGPWYDGLIEEFDTVHRGRAIENRKVFVYIGSSHVRYKCYVNELDTLTAEQVFWQPYEEDREYDLNQMCTHDSNIWRSRCPMICFYAVEFHFVDRVARQFGKHQGIPTEETRSVIINLHGLVEGTIRIYRIGLPNTIIG